MTNKKKDIFDKVLNNLESIKIEPIINYQESRELIRNIDYVNRLYPDNDSEYKIVALKDITINTERFIPLIDIQMKKNRLLKKDYIILNKFIDKKKRIMVNKLKKIKYDVIEGIDIGREIRKSSLYKAAKRVYDAVIRKLNEIKKKIVQALKELKKVMEILKKIKDELEGAIFQAKDKIANATEKLNKAKKEAEEKNKRILDDSREVLNKAKLDAKNVRIGAKLKVKYLILKARGNKDPIPFLDKQKIDTAMEIIKKYDPNMVSEMVRKGMNSVRETSNDSNNVGSGRVNMKTSMDLNMNTDFGKQPKLEGFSNLKPSKCIFNLLLIIIIVIIFYNQIK